MTTPLYRLLPALTAWWVSVGVAWANYDEYMTCGSGNDRHGRHYHQPELPCDLSKDSWCESPGNQYPWGSVRRFVYENQGLMKRMYGNQRHYSVLRAELLNDLYDEMFDEMIKRIAKPQHPSAGQPSKSARYHKPSHPSINTHDLKAGDKRPHNGRAMKVTIQPQYSSVRRQHAAPRPKSRPKGRRKVAGTSRLRASVQTRGTTTSTTATTSPSPSSPSTPKRTTTTTTTTTATSASTSPITVSEVQPTTTTTTVTMGDDALTTTTLWGEEGHEVHGTAASSHATDHLFEEETQATLLPPEDEDWESTWTTLADASSTDPSSAFPTVFSGDEEESFVSFTAPETSSPVPPTTEHDFSTGTEEAVEGGSQDFNSIPLDKDDLTTLTLGERLEEEGTDYDKDEIDLGIEEVLNEDKRRSDSTKQSQDQEEVKSEDLKAETRQQVDELRVDGNMREEVKMETSTPETVRIRKPVKGINACPVEEEFVAPYWANNTQGKTLALLNQYPFEQYIQWERCKHEHRQWYCRHGCRCEQQYRLHKLLAFDPTNECRGIFSDWFRFPSFCVCKCYNLHLFSSSSRMGRLNQDDEEEDYDDEYDDYFDDEEEEEDYGLQEFEEELLEDEEEEEMEPEVQEQEPEQKEEVRKEEEEQNNSYYYYRSRPSSPLANIPPQRRPRPPQRPYSHISPPSHTLEAPSHTFTPPSSQPLPATQAPETTTLGTLDAATPHYYFNLTNYARILYGKGQPLSLSRVPRSPGE